MGDNRSKVFISLTIALALGYRSRAGVISEGNEGEAIVGGRYQQHEPAFSFLHFHGPVEGPTYEVKVPYATNHEEDGLNIHGHEKHLEYGYAADFVAHPKYEFSYGVEDHETGDFHAQKETRDGNTVSGQYSVKEPGGGLRVVNYRADKDGFHAAVHTSGKNEHSLASCIGQGHRSMPRVHDHQIALGHEEEQDVHDYVLSYATKETY